MRAKLLMLLGLVGLMTMTAGCGSTKKGGGNGGGELQSGPSWYANHEDEEEGMLYGYGMSAGETNPALAEASAKAAAREDMASTLNTMVQAMMERYLASTAKGKDMEEEMRSVQTLRGITDQSVNGFRIIKQEAKGKYLYMRGRVSMKDFKKLLHDSAEINAALAKVKENSAEAFDKMDKILDEQAKKK